MFCEELEEACRDQMPASIPILALVYCKPTLIRVQEIFARFAKKRLPQPNLSHVIHQKNRSE